MGGCINKDKSVMAHRQSTNPPKKQSQIRTSNKLIRGNYGIRKNSEEKSLRISHSPLNSCPFLFEKFKKSDGSPEEVNLNFMLSSIIINIDEKEIFLQHINSNMIKVWIIYGGIQKVTETGLTVQINNYRQLQQVLIDHSSSSQSTGDLFGPIALKEKPTQSFLFILEPVLETQQTLYMIYRYQILANEGSYSLITQSMQWSSLSFRINDIYGSEQLFKCNSENQLCSICLSNQSDCILLPCRHMCLCNMCLQQVEKTKPNCPLCRKQYYAVVKYKSSES